MVTTKVKNLKLNKWKLASVFALVATTLVITIPIVRSQSPSIIKIDGSSTVYPITEAVAEEFQKEKRGVMRVTVGISGTGGGFKKFCSLEDSVRTDISDASRTIQPSEIEKCKAAGIEFIELPIAYDAITVVVNTENFVDTMSVEDLKKMWAPEAQGKVMKWNQVNSNWPDAELRMYGPGADSGTFDYFTKEIVGQSKASRSDYTPSEDDNVLVQGVANDPNAIAYFGYSYYEANRDLLKAIAIDNGNGPVKPSLETVRSGEYQPLARPIFIYVNAKAAERPEVKEFVEFYLKNAPQLVKEVNSVPLSELEYQQAMERFKNRVIGSGS
ncbi:MAG: PstS family phosphate ABC transporter substrate-binding protein [Okeania sp. SIO2G4]|uniref:PstS family phosphate ABC transporter substrate-binding protein n=1 Tax=unclassified Okeania TaxID=2634635 RepID=UPI0013B98EF1|nr:MULTISPECIES: PstS family phosphate ABC transporter substrate-binding protein [unclassified Okeania]NEP40709.1 PstS family phosphate ABC transporter substrate-binding protein [Okeania sp. SIO2H7]NEP73644.1 PstS family phosphate ABC transporter substrate-binding protein [Okeania sp. SIO2G5]NEP95187.1 PstS family phosphate ABC transporter substrate-binding protein [Okeania sp. SIO2F5]NEQ90626.1 PstS family phosphate ABC transporter substrate-binding protein [Okeania sp. SIO2G4]